MCVIESEAGDVGHGSRFEERREAPVNELVVTHLQHPQKGEGE